MRIHGIDEAREVSLSRTLLLGLSELLTTKDHHTHGLTPSAPHTPPAIGPIYILVYISTVDDLKSLRLTGYRPSCVPKRSRPKRLRTVPYAPSAQYVPSSTRRQVSSSNMEAGARIPHRRERHHPSTARHLPFSAPSADGLTCTYIKPCSYANTLAASYCLTSRQPGR